MSWLKDLDGELSSRRVSRGAHRRIVLELQDHIDCEPGCQDRLGDPREVAAQFADELAADGSRSSAFVAFGALAITAAALLTFHVALVTGTQAPDYHRGLSLLLFWPAILGILIGPQAALVAGLLAVLRAVRRRRHPVLPAAEIALIRRRTWIGLGAGMMTVAGLGLYVVDFSSVLPLRGLELVGGATGAAAIALLVASARLMRASSIVTCADGSSGDVFDDLPPVGHFGLRQHPVWVGTLASLTVAVAVTLVEWHAEYSLVEGLERGLVEGLAAALGFALLGRAIGVTAARAKQTPPAVVPVADH